MLTDMVKTAIIVLTLLSSGICSALDVPVLRARVNDYAGIISPEMERKLETTLQRFEQTDSTQIAVLTIPSLEGESLEGYSIKVAEQWKIGQKGRDNGAILLVSRDDRKLRIEVGYGLEGKLTDLMAGRIIRYNIIPEFKMGDYDRGIESGVDAMISVVRGEYTAQPTAARKPASNRKTSFITIMIFLYIFISILGAVSKVLGGIAGGIAVPVLAAIFIPGVTLIILIILIAVGFGLGMLLSIFSGRGGGFSGGPFIGGGFGGGGFSSGGFSGGGGGFGGGGASGGW